jgi:hypothetical protein
MPRDRASLNKWRREYYQRTKEHKMELRKQTTRPGGGPRGVRKATFANIGKAGECLVLCDLLARGLEVTEPKNVNTPDDLHARCGKWVSIQVKLGRYNIKTDNLVARAGRHNITSDILAVVDIPTRRVRYIAVRGRVPKELL